MLVILLFSVHPPTLAAEDEGRHGEDERRGQEDEQPEHREYSHHLTSVEEDGHPGVAQAAATLPGVVVAEQEVSLLVRH